MASAASALTSTAQFCSECGVPVSASAKPAEYIRGTCRWCLGLTGWRETTIGPSTWPTRLPRHCVPAPSGTCTCRRSRTECCYPVRQPRPKAAEIRSAAEQFGEQITVELAKTARGIAHVYRDGSERDAGARLLQELHEAARQKRFTIPNTVPLIDIHVARENARLGDVDGAIALARTVFDDYLRSGEVMWLGVATAVLVESLLHRGFEADVREARAAIAKLTAVPTEPGVVVLEIWLLRLRALLAQAEGDEVMYSEPPRCLPQDGHRARL